MSHESLNQNEENPRQKHLRIFRSDNVDLRASTIDELLGEPEALQCLEIINDWPIRDLLSEDEINKVVEHLSNTSSPVIATLAYGGNYKLFSEPQRVKLVQSVIDSNDRLSARNLINSMQRIPEDLKPEVVKVAEKGEAKTSSSDWINKM